MFGTFGPALETSIASDYWANRPSRNCAQISCEVTRDGIMRVESQGERLVDGRLARLLGLRGWRRKGGYDSIADAEHDASLDAHLLLTSEI